MPPGTADCPAGSAPPGGGAWPPAPPAGPRTAGTAPCRRAPPPTLPPGLPATRHLQCRYHHVTKPNGWQTRRELEPILHGKLSKNIKCASAEEESLRSAVGSRRSAVGGVTTRRRAGAREAALARLGAVSRSSAAGGCRALAAGG